MVQTTLEEVRSHTGQGYGTDRAVVVGARTFAALSLAAYAFAIPIQRAFEVPPFGSPATLAALFAAAAGGVAVVLGGRSHRPHPVVLLGVALVALVQLSLAWSPAPTETVEPGLRALAQSDAVAALGLAVTLGLCWEFLDRPTFRDRVFVGYVAGCHLASAVAVAEWRSDGGSSQLRITGGDAVLPNPQAFTLAVGIPLAWFVFLRSRHPVVRLTMLAYLPVGAGAVLLTGSRSGALALALGLLIVPLTIGKLPPLWRSLTIVALVCTLPVVPRLIPEDTLGRALATSETTDLASVTAKRAALRDIGIEVFLEHPITGSGIGSVRQLYAERNPGYDTRLSSHNSPINVAAEFGIVAFGLFIAMFLSLGRSLRRGDRLARSLAGLLFAMTVVVMQVVNLDFHRTTWFVVGLLVVHGRAASLERSSTGSSVT